MSGHRVLHHSDQGCTYASEDYQDVLEARRIVCSMSRRGNCWDNAVMESLFSTVKSELGERFNSHGADALLLATVTCAGVAVDLFAGPAWTWLFVAAVLGIGSYATSQRPED
jgi:transposase InsO family protein